jgi:hypothetical protein
MMENYQHNNKMKMNINFKKINIKKVLVYIIILFLTGYFLYDVSIKRINDFRLQGYQIAVQELAKQAENEGCYPFEIFLGEKTIELININCLKSQEEEEVFID